MCPSSADPNAGKKPSDPWVYRPGSLLQPSDRLTLQMLQCGMKNLTHEETAAVLGVGRTYLEKFWAENPDHRQAFLDGKQMRKVKLRATLDMHAQLDPATARFLAKNELALSDDPSKAKLDEQATKTLKGMSREEANKRILELTPKLIGSSVSRETYTTQEQAPPQEASQGQAQAFPLPAVKDLQARLAELEASTVRKNPRKDGQPHTDRTKAPPVDAAPNSRQEVRPAHAPQRLPGRLGSR